jgi:hypothetical protein
MKPDFIYQSKQLPVSTPIETLTENQKPLIHALRNDIESFSATMGSDMRRFQTNTHLSFSTNTNVLNSVSFLSKFHHCFVSSLRLLNDDNELLDIKEKLENIEKEVAEIVKKRNIENAYLLPLALGMTESLLKFENY